MSDGLPVFHSNTVHVAAERCSTCVFRPGNLMHLQPGRLAEIVRESIQDGGGITCHKTLYGQRHQELTCAGFYDQYGDRVLAFELAARLGMVKREQVEEEGCQGCQKGCQTSLD